MNEVNNQVTQEKVKKGVNPIVVIILCILFAAVAGVGGWFFGTKYASKEDTKVEDKETNQNNEENKEEGNADAVVSPDVNTKFTFAKDIKKELMFGDEKVELIARYYIDKESVSEMDPDGEKFDTYVLRREVFVNSKLIDRIYVLGDYTSSNAANDAINEDSVGSIGTLKDAKSNDVYNLIEVDINESVSEGIKHVMALDGRNTYIVNSKGNVLKTIESKIVGTGVIGVMADKSMINDKYYTTIKRDPEKDYPAGKDYYLYPDNRLIDLHDDYLYYFSFYIGDECGYADYKLAIENGKVVEKLDTDFDIDLLDGAGQSC